MLTEITWMNGNHSIYNLCAAHKDCETVDLPWLNSIEDYVKHTKLVSAEQDLIQDVVQL